MREFARKPRNRVKKDKRAVAPLITIPPPPKRGLRGTIVDFVAPRISVAGVWLEASLKVARPIST